MKLYELELNEEDGDILSYVAVVDRPAIESTTLYFKEQKKELEFKVVDEEKRIVSGYFMIADKEIYRNDEERGEHLVKFTPEQVKKIQLHFMKSNRNTNVNVMHSQDDIRNDIVIFESFIIDSERGMNAPKGFEQEADGSWFGSMYIPLSSQDVWEEIKEGRFTGFSVEGLFTYKKDKKKDKYVEQIEMLKQIIEEYEKNN